MAKIDPIKIWNEMDETNINYFYDTVVSNPIINNIDLLPLQKLWLSYIPNQGERMSALGNVGSGKSFLLAIQLIQLAYSGVDCLVFRRYTSDLLTKGNVIDLLDGLTLDWRDRREIEWNKNEKIFKFKCGYKGSISYRSASSKEIAQQRFRSQEYGTIMVEELSENEVEVLDFLPSRLRGNKKRIPYKYRKNKNGKLFKGMPFFYILTSNPTIDKIQREYIIKMFIEDRNIPEKNIKPAPYNYWFFDLKDNYFIDRESYIAQLKSLPPLEQKIYLEGDFSVDVPVTDALLEGYDLNSLIYEEPPNNDILAHLMSFDLAASEKTYYEIKKENKKKTRSGSGFIDAYLLKDGRVLINNSKLVFLNPAHIISWIRESHDNNIFKADEIFIEAWSGGGSSEMAMHLMDTNEELQDLPINWMYTAGKPKYTRSKIIKKYIDENLLFFKKDSTKEIIDELNRYPSKDHHDDCVDALSQLLKGIETYYGGISLKNQPMEETFIRKIERLINESMSN